MFFKLLIESKLTIKDALSILDLADGYSEDELKSAYKKKAKEHHPDKGGSVELMQKVNLSYEMLKGRNTTSKFNFEDMHKEYKELCKGINELIAKSFKRVEFTNYFKEVFGQPFKIVNVEYLGESYYKGKFKNQYGSPSYAGIKFSIESKDGTIVVDFVASIYLTDIKKGELSVDGGLPLNVVSTGFFSGRKLSVF